MPDAIVPLNIAAALGASARWRDLLAVSIATWNTAQLRILRDEVLRELHQRELIDEANHGAPR